MNEFFLGDVLLKLVTPAAQHDPIIGDFHERFYEIERSCGRRTARRRYYVDLIASTPLLALDRLAIGSHGRWVSSIGAGLIAFGSVFGALQVAERLKTQSAALTYAITIVATCSLCFVPRVVKGVGVLVLFFCIVAWTATFFVSHPTERIELRSTTFYLHFVRLALAMVGATIVSLVVRRTLRDTKIT